MHLCIKKYQFNSNSSAEIVCNPLNFNRKIFVFSRILAEFFFVLCDNSANPYISRFFSQPSVVFRLQIGGLSVVK